MAKGKKYELTDETIEWKGHLLFRIRALKSFFDVNAGDLGGFIESENNLSQRDKAWIYDNAKAYGSAMVFENARLYDESEVDEYAAVYGDACLFDCSYVTDFAYVYDDAELHDSACVCGFAHVGDRVKLFGEIVDDHDFPGDYDIDDDW